MFDITRQLSATTVADVKAFLAANIELDQDVSRYAPGRNRGWLQHEGPLSNNRSFVRRPCPQRLWAWLNEVWAKSGMDGRPELGLAAYGQIGIDLHRDASYAAPASLLINLGGVEWAYEPTRQAGDVVNHRVFQQGEVVRFDCKHRHGALDCHPDRWSIVLWRVSYKRRADFNSYLRSL